MKRLGIGASILALACGGTLIAPAGAATAAPELGYSTANMDRSVSPRQNFYQYANGNWLRRTAIPAAEADVGGFSQLGANLDQQLLKLIKDAAGAAAAPGSPQQQVGDFYRSAMDLQRLDALGLQPLQPDLNLLADLGAPAALGALSARLQQNFVVSPLVNAFAMADAKDSSSTLLVIHPGMQALEQDEYTKPDGQRVRDLYLDFMVKMFQSTGDTPERAAAHAKTVLTLETELAAARLNMLQMRDPATTYNLLSLAEVQALLPAVDLKAFLSGLGVPPPARVQVMDIGGLKALQSALTQHSSDDIRTLLRWHILSARASLLGQPWRGLDQEFNRQRKGLQQAQEREREVTQAIAGQLFHPLSQLYVQAYFPESTRRAITTMLGHIKDEYALRLRSNPWLDAPTRAAALEKLDKVDIQIGYPQQWIDFSAITIRADDYFGNSQRIAQFLQQREMAQVGKPVLKDRFAGPNVTTPIAVNAAYNPQTNSIDITAAIAQAPFYKAGADVAVNYCTMGAVIGHELTHGFDSFGRQFGPAGNLRDWWTPEATAEFKKRTDVLVQQYSAFTLLPGLKHNGALTLTENTADLGGITLAHAALQRALAGQPQAKQDGLTTDQRCFVAWSQLWAYKARPERIRLLAATDYHANSALRGYAPLLHLDAFHKAFGTRKGDAMWRAPKQRVRIW
ncbi:MAG: M13 family metallopeptidase [Rhodoferax sp.]|nr:M13 family metallopeptidase [Rhodoferax sp.]